MVLNIEKLVVIHELYARDILREAYRVAWENSTDNKTKTGAKITLDNNIVISGYNHLTDGIETLPEWNERPLKYKGTVHSEGDAITKAARQGIKLDGGVMYMPWLPCTQCYLMMKNAGIKRLVAHKNMIEMSPPHWEEDLNMMLYLAEKGNFEIILYEGKIGGVKSLFNGQEWEP